MKRNKLETNKTTKEKLPFNLKGKVLSGSDMTAQSTMVISWNSSGCNFWGCIRTLRLVMTFLLALETGDLFEGGLDTCSSEGGGLGIT